MPEDAACGRSLDEHLDDILGLLHGAGDPSGEGAGALEVRLVR